MYVFFHTLSRDSYCFYFSVAISVSVRLVTFLCEIGCLHARNAYTGNYRSDHHDIERVIVTFLIVFKMEIQRKGEDQ